MILVKVWPIVSSYALLHDSKDLEIKFQSKDLFQCSFSQKIIAIYKQVNKKNENESNKVLL